MKKVLILILAVLMVVGLAACGGGTDPSSSASASPSASAPVVTGVLKVFDLSNPQDITLDITGSPASLYQVRVGNTIVTAGEEGYQYADGVLTINKGKIGTTANTSKKIYVTVTDGAESLKFDLIVADKVITTCDQFQAINENLDGVYILGADLDFEDFGNFTPIGTNGIKSPAGNIGLDFTGSLLGAGHTISNLSTDASKTEGVYSETDVYVDEMNQYDLLIPCYAIFMRNSGTIKDICFKDCEVKNTVGTIMGMVVAVNEGTIENVILDGGKVIGGSIWLDYNCFVAGFAGMNGGSATISNCISTLTQVSGSTTGDLVRAFVGKTWGTIEYCYASSDGLTLADLAGGEMINNQGIVGAGASAPALSEATGFGFTYRAIESGTSMGSFENCGLYELDSMGAATLYSQYSTKVWSIVDGAIPSLLVQYSVA